MRGISVGNQMIPTPIVLEKLKPHHIQEEKGRKHWDVKKASEKRVKWSISMKGEKKHCSVARTLKIQSSASSESGKGCKALGKRTERVGELSKTTVGKRLPGGNNALQQDKERDRNFENLHRS